MKWVSPATSPTTPEAQSAPTFGEAIPAAIGPSTGFAAISAEADTVVQAPPAVIDAKVVIIPPTP